jgi:hypothetical protein
MTAKFTYNGVEITVPTSEIGEAMRQLGLMQRDASVPIATATLKSFDPQKRRIPSHLRSATPMPLQLKEKLPKSVGGSDKDTPDDLNYTLNVLRLVESRMAAGGASSQEVMKAFDTKGPRGLGFKTEMMNSLLVAHDFDLAEVYSKGRGQFGRVWLAGPKIKGAIAAIQADQLLSTGR